MYQDQAFGLLGNVSKVEGGTDILSHTGMRYGNVAVILEGWAGNEHELLLYGRGHQKLSNGRIAANDNKSLISRKYMAGSMARVTGLADQENCHLPSAEAGRFSVVYTGLESYPASFSASDYRLYRSALE